MVIVPYPDGSTEKWVDVRADPRLSNLRPGWLADDTAWKDQLQALGADEAKWLEGEWELAGGAKPDFDVFWMTTESIGGRALWPLLAPLTAFVVLFGLMLLFVGGGS